MFAASNLLFSQNLVINEVMSLNSSTIYDEDGDASDWIELYNNSAQQINLEGYHLSDDSLIIDMWQFGSVLIEPGGYLIVFASDKDTNRIYWHTNFKINASSGERIILSNATGSIIDQIDVPVVSDSDISYGRLSDGSLSWDFQFPSPGAANSGNIFQGYADAVDVSLPGGFYSSAVSIELTAGDSEIYYTLDGSDPDSSSTKYTAPINIQEISILKAISYKASHLPSNVIHHSYFINAESTLPVISLISDPYNLFDYNYGIYADGPGWTPGPPHRGANYWMDWERPAHLQFFDDNKNLGFSENCGIEIYGAYTRSFPQKSFTVKFKNDYGLSELEYPLFPGFDVTTFKSFILRNSGNDFEYTHIRDAMMQTLIKDLDIDYLEYCPAAAYINGEYWGIYNIREKISEHYIANRHGIDPDSIDLLEENMEVIHGDSLHYSELVDYITNADMTTEEAYNYVNSMIDLDNCLLYFAAHAYYNSQDWPGNNLKYWRERSPNGKWRWILFDLDFGFNLYETTGQAEDHVFYIFSGIETRPGSNPAWSTLLPRKLVENTDIKTKFINLVADLLNTNFKSERVVSVINNMADHIAVEAVNHRQRWGISQQTVDNHLQRMITFANERPNYLRDFVRNFFHCGNDGVININSTAGGKVRLNSLILGRDDFPWSGIYFRDNPITVTAVADAGYKFDSWSGAVNNNDMSVNLSVTGSTTLNASFSIDTSVIKEIVINEINYNSSDLFDSGDWVELYNRSDQTIDMSNWSFSDSEESHQFTFPAGTVLEPDQYIVLIENDDVFTSHFPDVENYISGMNFGLDGSGEFIKLVSSNGEIIDSLTYDDNSPWPTEPDGMGPTLELINANSENSYGENWKASRDHGTPGKVNSVVLPVDENKSGIIPQEFTLYQNYPNPFNPTTTFIFQIADFGLVVLKVYDVLGNEVATITNEELPAGNYKYNWDASGLSSGVYFYQLKAGSFMDTKKLILIK
jgi:hypothetical protein